MPSEAINTAGAATSNAVDMTAPATVDVEIGDLELIDRWSSGDQRAASALVERHAAAVARFVNRMGVVEDIDEVVQDTFVRAFESLSQFRGASAFRTWLFAIARRQVLDRQRRGSRGRVLRHLTEDDALTEFDPLDEYVARETGARMQHAIGKLTRTQREVFSLRVSEGLSYREIAGLTGTTEGSARVHYHNALRIMKEYLNG
jgi:RNA polymerase sigma-70 factor, ECF subfamily